MDVAFQEMPKILDALAAAGRRSGGLKLQQLQLPVFGSATMCSITGALSGCHQLQSLSLMDSCSGLSTGAAEPGSELPAALQQLTQLTSLRLQCGLFKYYKPITQGQGPNQDLHQGGSNTVDLDGFLESLPSRLVALSLEDYQEKHGRHSYTLSDGSLCHLVALQRLTLPADTLVRCNPEGSSTDPAEAASSSSSSSGCNRLAQLTAVTYLACGTALREEGAPLLALPNLVELRTGHVQLQLLEELAGKTALRSLGCLLSLSRCRTQVPFLTELTQLTGLGVVLRRGVTDARLLLEPVGDASEAGGCITTMLSGMPGLRQLRLESGLLLRMDVRALTALTSLAVLSSRPGEFAGNGSLLSQVTQHIQPLHGGLQGRIDIRAWQGSAGDILGPA